MPNYAQMENGLVKDIFVADQGRVLELMWPGFEFIEQTEETGLPFVGGVFDDGRFVPPSPFESWVYDSDLNGWCPPTPYPEDGKIYSWDEESLSWIEIVVQAEPEAPAEEVTASEAVADAE